MRRNSFLDALDVVMGKDLPEKPKARKKRKVAKDAPEKTPVSTREAWADSYSYANSDRLNFDACTALKEGTISDELRQLMEVLVDSPELAELIMSQCEVKEKEPDKDTYRVEIQYFQGNKEVDKKLVRDILVKLDNPDDLVNFNIERRFVRISKKDGKVIGEASPEQKAEIKKKEKERLDEELKRIAASEAKRKKKEDELAKEDAEKKKAEAKAKAGKADDADKSDK